MNLLLENYFLSTNIWSGSHWPPYEPCGVPVCKSHLQDYLVTFSSIPVVGNIFPSQVSCSSTSGRVVWCGTHQHHG